MCPSRRIFVVGVGVGTLHILQGCTKMLWKERQQSTISYTEAISSVLISEDGKYLVVIGEKYHYVFDAPVVLVKALKASFHKSLSAELGVFEVNTSGATSGSYRLFLSGSAPEQEKQGAIDAGFEKSSADAIEFSGVLKGTRYASSGFAETATSKKLNRTYTVTVIEDTTTTAAVVDTAARAALTPVTVAVDAATQAVFWYLVVPVGLVVLLIASPFVGKSGVAETELEEPK